MRTRKLQQVVTEFARRKPAELPDALRVRLVAAPDCPVARYLLGCHHLDRGRTALAVRQFMTAHHAEPQLQSAALLVFAGLSWVTRRDEQLLPVLLDTWEEFRRPEFDVLPRERLLLDALAEHDPGLSGAGPLARRLWRLPIRTLRAQIRQALLTPQAAPHALLTMA
jgi:hypothetical protein